MTRAGITESAAGAALIIGAMGTVIAMAHHPSGAHAGALGGIVHGAMIVLLLLLSWGFLMFAVGQGVARPLILGGLIAYAVSLFAHIGAGTINGFIVPALADPQVPSVSHDIFRLTWTANQALAHIGVYMTGLAYVLWSLDLLFERVRSSRLTGILGLVAGIMPAALLASGLIRMNVVGAFAAYALHASWAALVGLMILRGVLQPRAAYIQI